MCVYGGEWEGREGRGGGEKEEEIEWNIRNNFLTPKNSHTNILFKGNSLRLSLLDK